MNVVSKENRTLLNLYLCFIKDYFRKLGIPQETVQVYGFERLAGNVANTFLVNLGGIKLVLKHDSTVGHESEALAYLYTRFPKFFPKPLHYDQSNGLLLIPFYPYDNLHAILMDDSLPASIKIECFRRSYEILVHVIYEGELQKQSISDPHLVFIQRVIERIADWTNKEKMEAFLKKRLVVNGEEIGSYIDLIQKVIDQISKFACTYRVTVLGDEHPKNILISLSPLGSKVIFLDLPNASIDGEDPAKGWGKVLHWLFVYGGLLDELNSSSLDEQKIKDILKLNIIEKSDSIEICYQLKSLPMAEILAKEFEKILEDFSRRHNDHNWRLRLLLGWARADLGAVAHQRSIQIAIVLFAEGMRRLKELNDLLEKEEGEERK